MKQFNKWNELKQKLDDQNTVPFFNERQIWWCSVGINVGHEQDGKGITSSRPVLVVKKFNNRLFWGVPLSTKIKKSPHYHTFNFKGRDQSALLTQLRLWDANRITRRMGHIDPKQLAEIREKLKSYL